MLKKLKTWEEFEAEFRSTADSWKDYDAQSIYCAEIKINNIIWTITKDSKKLFGKYVDVKELKEKAYLSNFTHESDDGNYRYLFHELWFESDFFISENEFNIT